MRLLRYILNILMKKQIRKIFECLSKFSETLETLKAESMKAQYSKVLNTILSLLLTISFIINLVTINTPLIKRKDYNHIEQP